MRWHKQVIRWKICVELEIPTCGLWTGVRSLSSWLCGCRWTRFCDWAWWAIAFSFSGYNWASRARIYHTWQEDLCLDAQTLNSSQSYAAGLTWSSSIILTERSFSSCCLNSIISLLRSSDFSSSRISGEPMPSSFSSARLLFGEEPLNSC